MTPCAPRAAAGRRTVPAVSAPTVFAAAALLAPAALAAQVRPAQVRPAPERPAEPLPAFELTIPNIMRGPEHYGREPQGVRWSADGQWIYFTWAPAGSAWDAPSRLHRVRAVAGAVPERVPDAELDSIAPLIAEGPLSRDGRHRAVAAGGDLFLVDARRGTARALTRTADAESDPRFTADGRGLLFVRGGQGYLLDLASAAVRQLTDLRPGPAPRDSAAPTGQRAALERQQRELLAAVRERVRADSVARAERRAAEARAALRPTWLPAGTRVAALSVSPSLRTAVVVTTTAPVPPARVAQVPDYVTASGYTEEIATRGKVGDATARQQAWRLDLSTLVLEPLPVVGGDSARAASQVRVAGWSPDGTTALLAAYTPDFAWRYLVTAGATGAPRVVEALQDSAWVGGPCGGCMGWLPDGRVWYASEATGYAHLYAAGADGAGRTPLTAGAWEVLQADLSHDGTAFWLHTSEESPFVRHLYRMPAGGGARTRLTRAHGGHQVVPSPDGRRLADVFSEANVPPELFVAAADGSGAARLTVSTSPDFRGGRWIKPAIVHVPASDGVRVPARVYRPQDVGASPNGAAVIFVHGAGYLHNVHDYWSSYAREYLFHHLLAERGYVVLDLDYRASAGYGRDWRTAIDRWMGGRDLQDHVDGSRWLQREFGIAPERVGIYGGSYGGFITLMALFTAPREFGAGAALRSVTDWAHYNHGYTGGILNLPQDDTLAYRRSSPIFFAEGLEDPLLIAHGMVDTNVHFQDVVRLAQRLIELGKEGWEMAVYPVEDHGFVRPDSWTDEYRRILALFERTIGPAGSKARR